jgi:hypothetical protein
MDANKKKVTHDGLVVRAERWLRNSVEGFPC